MLKRSGTCLWYEYFMLKTTLQINVNIVQLKNRVFLDDTITFKKSS